MELNLKRPICFFDIESTGVNVVNDRIVELSVLKIFPDGKKESKTWLVNPEMEIPAETTAIHGITNEKIANEPTFKALAHTVHNMVKDSDLAGYNSNKFDIPMLAEEFLRAPGHGDEFFCGCPDREVIAPSTVRMIDGRPRKPQFCFSMTEKG